MSLVEIIASNSCTVSPQGMIGSPQLLVLPGRHLKGAPPAPSAGAAVVFLRGTLGLPAAVRGSAMDKDLPGGVSSRNLRCGGECRAALETQELARDTAGVGRVCGECMRGQQRSKSQE